VLNDVIIIFLKISMPNVLVIKEEFHQYVGRTFGKSPYPYKT
jgi:hypothetical protein